MNTVRRKAFVSKAINKADPLLAVRAVIMYAQDASARGSVSTIEKIETIIKDGGNLAKVREFMAEHKGQMTHFIHGTGTGPQIAPIIEPLKAKDGV